MTSLHKVMSTRVEIAVYQMWTIVANSAKTVKHGMECMQINYIMVQLDLQGH